MYGVEQKLEFVIAIFIDLIKNNKSPVIYGDGEQIRSYCNIEDICRGVGLSLNNKNAVNTIINLGNNTEPISVNNLAKMLINLSGLDLKLKYKNLDDSDRSVSREIYRRIPDIEKAKKLLNYKPRISLEEGLKMMI